MDLTSVAKAGKQLPFVRVYNGVFGIHLVVLFVVADKLKFPVGYRVYRGKGTTTPVNLALELLREVPPFIRKKFECVVLADAGFGSIAFMRDVRQLGFDFVVGVRGDRALRRFRGHVKDKAHGALVTLRGFDGTLTLSRFDRGRKTFYAVASSILKGDEVAQRYRVRWQQESFFHSGKHNFGLQRFQLRSEVGLDRWLLLVFTAFSLTMLHRLPKEAMEVAAKRVIGDVLAEVVVVNLVRLIEDEREFLLQHGIEVTLARCKL